MASVWHAIPLIRRFDRGAAWRMFSNVAVPGPLQHDLRPGTHSGATSDRTDGASAMTEDGEPLLGRKPTNFEPFSRDCARGASESSLCAAARSLARLPRASLRRRGCRFQRESLSRVRQRRGWSGRHRKLAAGASGLHVRLMLPQFGRLLGHIFQADALVAAALGHNAVIERYVGRPAALLANFKAGGGFAGDVESLAVAIRSQEDMIGLAGIDRGGKGRFECDLRAAAG